MAAMFFTVAGNFADAQEMALPEGDARLLIEGVCTATEWEVPTLGQRSRDPIEAQDDNVRLKVADVRSRI